MKKQTSLSLFSILMSFILFAGIITSCSSDDDIATKMLPSEISGENSVTQYEYDNNNRLIKVSEIRNDITDTVLYYYDDNNNLQKMVKSNSKNDSTSTTLFNHIGDTIFVKQHTSENNLADTLIVDINGRLIKEMRALNNIRNVATYAYNVDGSMTRQVYRTVPLLNTKSDAITLTEQYSSYTTFSYDGFKGILSEVNIKPWQIIYLEFGFGYAGNYTQSKSEYAIRKGEKILKSGLETKVGSYFYNLENYPTKMVWKVLENDLVKDEVTFNISYIEAY